jgi:uncharacterized protein YigA (DUF484 family)
MAKKSAKVDELSELVLDEKIVNTLVTRLTALLTPIMETLVRQIATEVTTSLTKNMEVTKLETFTKIEETMSEVKEQVNSQRVTTKSLQAKIEDLERHARLGNLIFHGVPELSPVNTSDEIQFHQSESEHATTAVITQICRERLNLNLTNLDISTAHRLPGKQNSSHRPIIVSFTTRRVRNEVYQAKKLLRMSSTHNSSHSQGQERIFINEHLTANAAHLYAAARAMVKDKVIASSWSNGGNIYIRKTLAADDTPKKITSLEDLNNLAST